MHRLLWTGPIAAILAAFVVANASPAVSTAGRAACSSGYVSAHLSWGDRCLHRGQFCTVGSVEYRPYGFDCPAGGHLVTEKPASTHSVPLGRTVLLAHRSRTQRCKLGANPDRRCSPGAYYSGLTKAVICSAGFRTSTVRNVPESEKFAIEREYGLAAAHYGRTLEIDHIVSLELGGSNDIANLYPERANASPGYHVKDVLENKLHDLVCSGAMTLRTAQRGIAQNWQALYKNVYGFVPSSAG